MIMSVDQWFHAWSLVSGNFRTSGGATLLLGPNHISLFIKPTMIRFSILFLPLWGQTLGISCQFFRNYHLREHIFGLWPRFGCWSLWEQCFWCTYQWDGLLWPTASSVCNAPDLIQVWSAPGQLAKAWHLIHFGHRIHFYYYVAFEVRTPRCFHNIPKPGAAPRANHYQYKCLAVLPLATVRARGKSPNSVCVFEEAGGEGSILMISRELW